MSHTHPGSRYFPRVCDLPTKKACDERLARWKQQQKANYEAAEARRNEQRRGMVEDQFQRFMAKEALRVAELLGVGPGGELPPSSPEVREPAADNDGQWDPWSGLSTRAQGQDSRKATPAGDLSTINFRRLTPH